MSANANHERGSRQRSLSAAPAPYQLENSKSKSTFLSRFKSTSPLPPLPKQQQQQQQLQPSAFKSATINNANNNDSLPSIIPQYQKIKRKPISPNNSESTIYKDVDLIRGMKNPEHDHFMPESTNSKKKNSGTSSGLGRLFGKRRKSIDNKKQPPLPPLVLENEYKKFELPPLQLTNISTDLEISQLQQPKEIQPTPTKVYYTNSTIDTNNIYSSKSNNNNTINTTNHNNNNSNNNNNNNNNTTTSTNTRLSTASIRKSSGSYSIYSTFGSSDSIQYGDHQDGTITSNSTIDIITEPEKNDKVDLVSIISNNLQLRTQARVINHLSSEDEDEDDDDDDDSLNEDVFVDATGYTQEELEKEKIESRLSKRLSGGHFGSAGGLMVSIMSASDTKQRRRTSKPPPEDVAKSMLNWKRKSGQGLNAFSNQDIKEEEQHETEQSGAVEQPPAVPEKPVRHPSPNRPLPPRPDIVLTAEDEPSAKEAAAKLWNEDESFVQRERMAEWLGQSKLLNTKTLVYYMNYFDFAKLRIDSAFRKLCSKLYFKAEAQQIDRILESFSKRYWECNPRSIFGSVDIVYAVVYSLLLLNTDLHVAQGSYTRMTRSAFIKNTMSTIRDQQATSKRSQSYTLAWESNVESYLKDLYTSVKHNQILQPNASPEDLLNPLVIGDESLKKSGKLKRGLTTMIQKSSSMRDSILFLDEAAPRKSTSTTKINFLHSPRRGSFSSINSAHSSIPLSPSSPSSPFLGGRGGKSLSSNQHAPMMQFMDTHGADLFANRPPYLKEGIVMRKHLLISANQKAKHREWRECLLIVGEGELKMYGLQSNNGLAPDTNKKGYLRASSASLSNVADSLYSSQSQQGSVSFGGVSQNSKGWAQCSQLLGSVKLNHTLSNTLPPPGYNRNRPHVFALQEPSGGVYLFQTASHTQLSEWVMTCNYWAARQSKEPLPGGVGNLEYGWGHCLHDVILDLDAVEDNKKVTGNYINDPDAVHLSHWVPPAPTMVSSTLSERDHLSSLEKYLVSLNQEIDEHREIKKKLLVKFPPKCQNYQKALTNWESKSNHLLHEIIKYQNYCNVLEESIVRQTEEKLEIANMSTDSIVSL
ncbi:hypothetical protein K501DRAFT_210989 [Backusella circina FSU 941]|nr:hypothetical protein K501DRAFT_210989 [Backusella circina FSU 941]